MTFWPLTNSDFPTDQTFHQFHDLYTELDLHRIMSGFHGAFATDVASQQGTLTLPEDLVPSPILGLANAPIVESPDFSNLPCLYSTFHLRIPQIFVLYSILLYNKYCPPPYMQVILLFIMLDKYVNMQGIYANIRLG